MDERPHGQVHNHHVPEVTHFLISYCTRALVYMYKHCTRDLYYNEYHLPVTCSQGGPQLVRRHLDLPRGEGRQDLQARAGQGGQGPGAGGQLMSTMLQIGSFKP